MRTCLSREFAFLGREAAVFRGCPGRDEQHGSAETRGRGNIWPKGGDISVGPYSSTAPPVTKTLPKVATEMALSVLAYNLTRVMNIVGVKSLITAIGT